MKKEGGENWTVNCTGPQSFHKRRMPWPTKRRKVFNVRVLPIPKNLLHIILFIPYYISKAKVKICLKLVKKRQKSLKTIQIFLPILSILKYFIVHMFTAFKYF